MSQNIKEIMGETMDKVKAMASADTIIGDPIVMSDKVSCVPISKVSYGFASGGSDFGKNPSPNKSFAGGGGAGMTITPVAFLVLQDDRVRVLGIDDTESAGEKAIAMIPDVVEKIKDLFKKDKENEEE